jgi:hypothetical protein
VPVVAGGAWQEPDLAGEGLRRRQVDRLLDRHPQRGPPELRRIELAGPTRGVDQRVARRLALAQRTADNRARLPAGTARNHGLVVDRGASVPPVGLVVVTVSVWTVVACSVVV